MIRVVRSLLFLVAVCSLLALQLGAQEPKPKRTRTVPGKLPARAQPAPAAAPAPEAVGRRTPPIKGCDPAVRTWWKERAGTGNLGRTVCADDPTRPAILLFHGTLQDGRTWTAPSYTEYAYDHKHHPPKTKVGGMHDLGNSGPYKVSKSKWLYDSKAAEGRPRWDKANNWFDFLVQQGFTVATWSQNMPTVSAAMPSARAAFDAFLAQTAARSPGAPPRVALIAHGRGGLLVRQVLKEKGSQGRVKWVVTLHSPHAGSEVDRTPAKLTAEVADLMDCCTPATVQQPFKSQLRQLAVEGIFPLTKSLMADESRELQPDSPLFRNLREGEKKLDDVTYYTFGGTNPLMSRLYFWLFDAESAKPKYTEDGKQYFVWRAVPVEITNVSPLLDKIRDFAPEVAPGKGDGLVSDASSRLPWSIHTTTSLNHAELLWDRPLMSRVAGLLGNGRGRM